MKKKIPAHYWAFVEERSQHSVGGGLGAFGGPDRYAAVQYVPPGVRPLRYLNHRVAKIRGILISYCGEGYSHRRGPTSMLGKALSNAQALANAQNDRAAKACELRHQLASLEK